MLYLLHFSEPLAHARHYLGYCADGELEQRLERHRSGRGARIMAAVEAAGIKWRVVRTWEDGDRTEERRLKVRAHIALLCPLCRAAALRRRRMARRAARRAARKGAGA